MATLTIWKDRDNPAFVQLLKGGELLTEDEMDAITKIEILFNGTYYSSTDHAGMFDWATYKSAAKVMITAGLVDMGDVLIDKKAELIVYDASNTNGIVWTQMKIVIKADAEVV